MSERDRTLGWRAVGLQAEVPCSDDAACLVTASPNSQSSSPHGDCYTAPSAFVSSGWLRVQWALTTYAQRLTHARHVT
jgi:hypothetical protein